MSPAGGSHLAGWRDRRPCDRPARRPRREGGGSSAMGLIPALNSSLPRGRGTRDTPDRHSFRRDHVHRDRRGRGQRRGRPVGPDAREGQIFPCLFDDEIAWMKDHGPERRWRTARPSSRGAAARRLPPRARRRRRDPRPGGGWRRQGHHDARAAAVHRRIRLLRRPQDPGRRACQGGDARPPPRPRPLPAYVLHRAGYRRDDHAAFVLRRFAVIVNGGWRHGGGRDRPSRRDPHPALPVAQRLSRRGLRPRRRGGPRPDGRSR